VSALLLLLDEQFSDLNRDLQRGPQAVAKALMQAVNFRDCA
jgi:hypothetical protein